MVAQDFCDWRVHHCYGCDGFTHLTHKVKGSKVLVSSIMEHQGEALSSLEQSRDYSPVFKIILRDRQEEEEEEEEEPMFRKRGG